MDAWIASEQKGELFPVPFDIAWGLAGYSTKASAKRALKDVEATHVSTQRVKKKSSNVSGVTSREDIMLTVKGFHQFCRRKQLNSIKPDKAKSVYIIQCPQTKLIKIGISADPLGRLSGLQTGYPFKLNLLRVIESKKYTAKRLEKILHIALIDFRLEGEWFDGLALQMIGSL